jgi:hypothetical protein
LEEVADKCPEDVVIQIIIINRTIKGEETKNINTNLTNFLKTKLGIKINLRIITPKIPIRVMIPALTLNNSNR